MQCAMMLKKKSIILILYIQISLGRGSISVRAFFFLILKIFEMRIGIRNILQRGEEERRKYLSVVSKTRMSRRGCAEEIGGSSRTYCPLNPLQLPHILAPSSLVGGDVG